jgi:L-ribulose-5-phosphate 3-epimerase
VQRELSSVNPIAIMQGRLSPPSLHIQAFPWRNWEQEFDLAAKLGFDGIEWLFDGDRWEENPIMSEAGVKAIRRRIDATDVQVFSVCGNYFMPHPFFRVTEDERKQSIDVFCRLIQQAAEIKASTILLPVLEVSELRTDGERDLLLEAIEKPLQIAAENEICVGIETELSYQAYRALVEMHPHSNLGVYYDVGNATAAGHRAEIELKELAPHLLGVHVKDRRRAGPSVPLGEGDTNFQAIFTTLGRVNYRNHLVLETASGPDFLAQARRSLDFVRCGLAKAL